MTSLIVLIALDVCSAACLASPANPVLLFLSSSRARWCRLKPLKNSRPHALSFFRFIRHVLRLLVFYLAFTSQGWDFIHDKDTCPLGYELKQANGKWLDCDTGLEVDP